MPNAIEWRPHDGPQTEFHECGAYEVLFGGAKGPGKTEGLIRESTRQIEKEYYRGIIFRRTYPRLGEIIDRSHKYFLGMGGVFSSKDQQIGLPAWTFKTGAKIAFGHVQHEKDKWNYHGKEFQFMGFDEVAEFTETQYLFLMAQNRTSDGSLQCYIRATANPGGVGHGWVKKRWIDVCKPGKIHFFKRVEDDDIEVDRDDVHAVSRAFIPASVFDNPSITQNDPMYIRRLEQLNETDKQAFLYGNWDVFSGQFFKVWRKSIHVKYREIKKEYRKFCSLDYGYGAPSSVGWWFTDFEGRLHRYRELYREGLTYEKLAYLIMEMTAEDEKIDYLVADPAIFGDRSRHREGVSGESGGETIQSVFGNFAAVFRADNSRLPGWGRLKNLMEPTVDNNGEMTAMITCSPDCKDSVRTIPNLVYSEKDGKPIEDLNTEGEDHAADDWRYAVMSRPTTSERKPVKPTKNTVEDWERREKVQALRNGEDLEDYEEAM